MCFSSRIVMGGGEASGLYINRPFTPDRGSPRKRSNQSGKFDGRTPPRKVYCFRAQLTSASISRNRWYCDCETIAVNYYNGRIIRSRTPKIITVRLWIIDLRKRRRGGGPVRPWKRLTGRRRRWGESMGAVCVCVGGGGGRDYRRRGLLSEKNP